MPFFGVVMTLAEGRCDPDDRTDHEQEEDAEQDDGEEHAHYGFILLHWALKKQLKTRVGIGTGSWYKTIWIYATTRSWW